MFKSSRISDIFEDRDQDSEDEDTNLIFKGLVLKGNITDLDVENKALERHHLEEEKRKREEEEEKRRIEEIERLKILPVPAVIDDPIPETVLSPSFEKVRRVLLDAGVKDENHRKVFDALNVMHQAMVGVAAQGTAKILAEMIDPSPEESEVADATRTCKDVVKMYKRKNEYNDRKKQRHEAYLKGPPRLTSAQRVEEFNSQVHTVASRIMRLDWDRTQLVEAHNMSRFQRFKGPFSQNVVAVKREQAEKSQRHLIESVRCLQSLGRSIMSSVSITLQNAAEKYEAALHRYEVEEEAAFIRLRIIVEKDITSQRCMLPLGNSTPSSKSAAPAQVANNPKRLEQKLSSEGQDIAYGTDCQDGASPTDKRFLVGLMHDALIAAPYLMTLLRQAVYTSHCDEAFEGYDNNPNGTAFEIPLQQVHRCEMKAKMWYDGSYSMLVDIARAAIVCPTVMGICEIMIQLREMEAKGEIAIDLIRNGFAERLSSPDFDLGLNGGFRWGTTAHNEASAIYLNVYIRFIDSPYIPARMKHFPHVMECRFILSSMYDIERSLVTGPHAEAVCWAKNAFPGFDSSYKITGSLNSANYLNPAVGGVSTEAIRCGLVTSIDLGCIMKVDVGVMNELAQLAKISLDPHCRLVEIKAENTSFATNLGCLFSSNPPNASIECHKKLRSLKLAGAEILGTLDPIEHLDSLRVLDLSSCFGVEGPLDAFDGWLHLRVLNLESTQVEGSLEPLEYCTALEYINVSNCVHMCGTLDPLANLKRLKTLWLSGCSRFTGSIFPILRCRSLSNFNASRSKIEIPPGCPKADAHGPPLVYPDRASCLALLDWMAEATGATIVRLEGGFSVVV